MQGRSNGVKGVWGGGGGGIVCCLRQRRKKMCSIQVQIAQFWRHNYIYSNVLNSLASIIVRV